MRFHIVISVLIGIMAATLTISGVYFAYGWSGIALLVALSASACLNSFLHVRAIERIVSRA